MKLDLMEYEKELDKLVKNKELSEESSKTYLSCLRTIQKNCENINPSELKDFFLKNIKTRNQFMKYVAAVRKYEKSVLKQNKGILYGEPEIELFSFFKGNSSYKPKIPNMSEEKTLRKINALRNEKLKYALRLQLKSGLRVSEISDLNEDDFKFEDGKIKISVRHGKGDKAREVNVIRDDYLYTKLPSFIEDNKGKRLFYSKDYIRIKAAEYGIETHDLRRHNARKRMKIEMNKGNTKKKAKKIVQRELGHETLRMTSIYIGEGGEKE